MRLRQAFTMIELIVVLVILGLLSSLAALTVRSSFDRHALASAFETIELFDQRLRRDARVARQPITATVDGFRGEMRLPEANGQSKIFRLPRRVVIKSVLSATVRSATQSFPLTVGIDGRTSSYAIELEAGGASSWLVVLGGSGQASRVKERRTAEDLLKLET